MKAVRETLTPLAGVEKVDVNFAAKLATLTVDHDKFDKEAALSELAAKNYPSKLHASSN